MHFLRPDIQQQVELRERNLVPFRYVSFEIVVEFADVFADYDFAVLPVAPCPAPLLGEATELREAHLRLTTPGSLGQLPILTVPYFLESGLSGGLQIIVPDLSEKSLSIWRHVLNG